jgi:hypothetical protein
MKVNSLDMSVSRSEVYDAVDGERQYQAKWGDLDTVNSVGDFLHYIQRYVKLASEAIDPKQNENALHNIRKITALGVACMEAHGAPRR